MFILFEFDIQCGSSIMILIMVLFYLLRDILFRQFVNELDLNKF